MFYAEINPLHPIGIFAQNTPLYFKGNAPDNYQFSIAHSMGNNWLPQSTILYPQNITEIQKKEIDQLYMTERPLYFEANGIQTQAKTFQSDGILQSLKLTYLHEWGSKNAFIGNVNINWLSGGSSFIHYFATDLFIENLHSSFFVDNNFGRQQFPYNKAFIELTDENGNSFRKNEGDLFLSTIDLHFFRQAWKYFDTNKWVEWQVGAHLTIPANSIHPYLIPGLTSGFRTEIFTGKNTSLSFTADFGLSEQTFLKLGEGISAIDWKFRKQAKLYAGYNFTSNKQGVFSIGIVNNYQDQLLKGSYFTKDQTGYNQLGISFLEAGDVWEGELIQQPFRHAKLTAAALYFLSLKSYLVFGFQKSSHKFSFSIGEDFFSVNNAPDIQYGFQYCFSLPTIK